LKITKGHWLRIYNQNYTTHNIRGYEGSSLSDRTTNLKDKHHAFMQAIAILVLYNPSPHSINTSQ